MRSDISAYATLKSISMNDEKRTINGFSKLSKSEKLKWIADNFLQNPEDAISTISSYWHPESDFQKVFDGFSENTITNFHMPYGVAPNFLINDKVYCVPMVIEESSVVAAASSAAKYWMDRGGFKAHIIDTEKIGQIHLKSSVSYTDLNKIFKQYHIDILDECKDITRNMEARGGGVVGAELIKFEQAHDCYQIRMRFQTCDSMGANFINTVLEQYAKKFKELVDRVALSVDSVEIIMSILSNYTPDCLVRTEVACPISELGEFPHGLSAEGFANKFVQAINIAVMDSYRAVTHNKGIFNGIDAVVLATGNDFRAVEACGHAYAAKDGRYTSLSNAAITDGTFHFWMEVPLALGTVGGLTNTHPMARYSLEMLGNPSVSELMFIIATVGLAQNFAAIRSLVTTGIQKGHMKMHLTNILYQLKATEKEFILAMNHFTDEVISYTAVRNFIDQLRIKPRISSKNSEFN